jgi:hypothetical protein
LHLKVHGGKWLTLDNSWGLEVVSPYFYFYYYIHMFKVSLFFFFRMFHTVVKKIKNKINIHKCIIFVNMACKGICILLRFLLTVTFWTHVVHKTIIIFTLGHLFE